MSSATSSAFGEHLRRERELRGIPLEEVCAATRISMPFLEAIENGNWNALPGGVFRRGFIRSVSRFLGLNEENMVAEYAMETQDDTKPSPDVKAFAGGRRNRAFSVCLAVILAAIAVVAGYVHVERSKSRPPGTVPSLSTP